MVTDALSNIGLLVKAKRLSLALRQADLKAAIGISPHTLRKIESGSELVDLRSFMLVLWRLGIADVVFASLEGADRDQGLLPHHQSAPAPCINPMNLRHAPRGQTATTAAGG